MLWFSAPISFQGHLCRLQTVDYGLTGWRDSLPVEHRIHIHMHVCRMLLSIPAKSQHLPTPVPCHVFSWCQGVKIHVYFVQNNFCFLFLYLSHTRSSACIQVSFIFLHHCVVHFIVFLYATYSDLSPPCDVCVMHVWSKEVQYKQLQVTNKGFIIIIS